MYSPTPLEQIEMFEEGKKVLDKQKKKGKLNTMSEENTITATVEIHGITQSERLNPFDDLAISHATLDDDCISQARLYFWYGVLAENAKTEVSKAKNQCDVVKAEADQRVRESFDGVKTTEAKVAAGVLLDVEYQKAQQNLIEAQHTAGVLAMLLRAFSDRRDMLITLAANDRHGVSSDVSILEQDGYDSDRITELLNNEDKNE